MRTQLGLVVVALSAPVSAFADSAPRGALSAGIDVGAHDHANDAGAQLGAGLDAELGLGSFTVGAELGYDGYALLDGVPVHAGSVAGRAGIAVPLSGTSRRRTGRTVQLDAISSVEVGMHLYSPQGERKDFLFSGRTSYRGEGESTTFVGVRAGGAMTIHRDGSSNGMLLKLELVGRRDLGTADLEYDRTSCGGLFTDANDCSDPTHGMVRVGGSELGLTMSLGVTFGGA